MKELGGVSNIGKAPPAKLGQLAVELEQRGQAYFDLYEYQRVIVRDHAKMLDSAARAGRPTFADAPYFRARALHELGDVAGATAGYRKAVTTVPARLRGSAADWLTALTNTSGHLWQQDLAAWRAGTRVTSVACTTPSSQCALFQAIVAEDVAKITRLQSELRAHATPDDSETQKSAQGAVTVDFFDPVTMFLLGAADYTTAAKLLSGRTERELVALRGIALLRTGHFKEAEVALRPFVASGGSAAQWAPYLGEALYRQGNRAEAETVWRGATGASLNVLMDVKSSLGLDSALVSRQYASERQRGLDRFINPGEGGLFLARALLRVNLIAEAEELLNAVRPASRGNNLDGNTAAQLAVLSHAEYRRGQMSGYRDRYNAARSDLASIAAAAPVTGSILHQLQELTLIREGTSAARMFDDL